MAWLTSSIGGLVKIVGRNIHSASKDRTHLHNREGGGEGLRVFRVGWAGFWRDFVPFVILLFHPALTFAQPSHRPTAPAGTLSGEAQHLAAPYGNLPLSFEANHGQADGRVRFMSRGSGYTLFLTPDEAVLSLRRPSAEDSGAVASDAVRLRLVGANPNPMVTGVDELPGRSNYFLGSDPAKWRTDVPHMARVCYDRIYPGIDLIYYGTTQRRLEYDFVVAPGADPDQIRLQFKGADSLRLDDDCNLVLYTPGGEVLLKAPVTYQEIDGVRQEIPSRYVFLSPPFPHRSEQVPLFEKRGQGGFPSPAHRRIRLLTPVS